MADSKAELEIKLKELECEDESESSLEEPSNGYKRKRPINDDSSSVEVNELRKKSKKEQQEEKKQKKRAEIDAVKEIGMRWLQRKDCTKCIELQLRVDELQEKLSQQKCDIEARNETIMQLEQKLKLAECGSLSKNTLCKFFVVDVCNT